LDTAASLLEQDCDINRADKAGWTALHYAARHGHIKVAQLLLRHGANLDARTNRSRRIPADYAAQYGHDAIVDAIRAEEERRRSDRSTKGGHGSIEE